MWRSALADLGTFARNTGQTLISQASASKPWSLACPARP